MKPTDFAKYLTEFLSVYLPSQKNVSKNTVYSYRDTFKLLIKYCLETQNIPAERITMNLLSNELIVGFLQWLEVERRCSFLPGIYGWQPSILFFVTFKARNPLGCTISKKSCLFPLKRQGK
jgi:integrase/recombinase XerD